MTGRQVISYRLPPLQKYVHEGQRRATLSFVECCYNLVDEYLSEHT